MDEGWVGGGEWEGTGVSWGGVVGKRVQVGRLFSMHNEEEEVVSSLCI
jgi:hypothetical protein